MSSIYKDNNQFTMIVIRWLNTIVNWPSYICVLFDIFYLYSCMYLTIIFIYREFLSESMQAAISVAMCLPSYTVYCMKTIQRLRFLHSSWYELKDIKKSRIEPYSIRISDLVQSTEMVKSGSLSPVVKLDIDPSNSGS